MLNIFAFRATRPRDMKEAEDPVGLENDLNLLLAPRNRIRVACWGAHGSHLQRDNEVRATLHGLQCLGRNADGSPKHPLYLKADNALELF